MTRTTASAPKRTTLTLDDRGLLPEGWVTTYVEDACTAISSPPIWSLAAALALAAHSLAKSGWTVEGGYRTRTALPFAILSKSGSGKGLAINYLRQFLYDLYSTPDLPTVLLDDCLKDEDTDTYKAALLEFTGTPEGLFWEMEERLYAAPNLREGAKASCVLGVHDEMHELFARNRNHPYFFTGIIAAQDQHPEIRRTQVNIKQMKKEKIAGRTGIIPNPALSTLFATAEARLREVIRIEDLTGGFCSRFMWLAQPEDWKDPRTIDDDWLTPRDETDRDSSLTARTAYKAWLLNIIGLGDGPGRIIFNREEIKAWNTPNAKHWIAAFAGADLGELGARADIHLLMLAATFAGAEGKVLKDAYERRFIRVEQRHYQLADDFYQHVAKGIAWLSKAAREQDAPTIVDLLRNTPQGLGRDEIGRAIGVSTDTVTRWIKNLLEEEEIIEARLEKGGTGPRQHLYFHPQFHKQICGKKYKNGPAWELTPEKRAAIKPLEGDT